MKPFKPTCDPKYIPYPASWLNDGSWLASVGEPDAEAKKTQAQADLKAALEQLRAEEDEGRWRQ